jgi:hypothetical protein
MIRIRIDSPAARVIAVALGLAALAAWVPPALALALGTASLAVWAGREALRVEREFSRLLGARGKRPPGLGPEADRLPIATLPDPVPNALVVRGPLGAGRVFVSQGLLSQLSDDELQAVLRLCRERLSAPGLARRCVTALLAHRLLERSPATWVNLLVAGEGRSARPSGATQAWQLFGFAAMLPLIRLLFGFARPSVASAGLGGLEGDRHLVAALRKIDRAQRLWPRPGPLALRPFWLVPPADSRPTLPL